VNNGQLTVDSGQLTVDSGQLTVVSGLRHFRYLKFPYRREYWFCYQCI